MENKQNKKNETFEENNNQNNLSFLFNKNNENKVNNSNNKKKNTSNKKVNNYIQNQKDLIGEETLAFLGSSFSFIRSVKINWENTPFAIKVAYVFIFLSALYYFLEVNYNLYGAVISALLLFCILFLINVYAAIVYLVVIMLFIYNKRSERLRLLGTLIESTKIVDNRPYDGTEDNDYVLASDLPNELTVGTFAYGFWLYLNKPFENIPIYRNNQWKSIFYRGSELDSKNDISHLTQYVGVWLKPDNQTLAFVFQQNGSQNESIELTNVEFNVWSYYVVNVTNNSVNVFKDGKLEVSSSLNQNAISMNDYGLFITSDYATAQLEIIQNDDSMESGDMSSEENEFYGKTGFDGNIAYLTYYEYNLTPKDIEDAKKLYENEVSSYEKYKESKIENYVTPLIM